MLGLLPLLALALPGGLDPSVMLKDRATGTLFAATRQADGVDYRCLGTGGHKVLGFKVYAVAFCLDEQKAGALVRDYAAARYPDKSGDALADALGEDSDFFETLIRAPADKMIVLQFLRNIPREKLAGSFENSLRRYLGPVDAKRLADSLDTDVRRGQVATFHSHGGDLVLQLEKQSKRFEQDPAAQQLWRVWLGHHSPTPGLRRSIAVGAAQSGS